MARSILDQRNSSQRLTIESRKLSLLLRLPAMHPIMETQNRPIANTLIGLVIMDRRYVFQTSVGKKMAVVVFSLT